MVDTPSTGTKHAPALNEDSFQQLLAAAFVVQQHNDRLRAQRIPAPASVASAPSQNPAITCRGCGHIFTDDESFCGVCGTSRSLESSDLQSKWASLWFMQQATYQTERPANGSSTTATNPPYKPPQAITREIAPENTAGKTPAEASSQPELEEFLQGFGTDDAPAMPDFRSKPVDHVEEDEISVAPKLHESGHLLEEATHPAGASPSVSETSVAEEASTSPTAASYEIAPAENIWSSAARARAWLESVKKQRPNKLWLDTNRANLYLVISVILLVAVLFGWGSPSRITPQNSAQPQLTTFEHFLVDIGIAEAPPSRAFLGNPNTQVWEDVHTALYYCPGADLYGKTPGGKIATQRDAQLDQFEPALRRACD